MRSLFVRIFFWFWLAMALVFLASTVSSMLTFGEGPKHLGGQLAMFGIAAVDKYRIEGRQGADDYLSLLERTTRTRAYLFDENGIEIAGPDPPPKLSELAQSLSAGGRDRVTQSS